MSAARGSAGASKSRAPLALGLAVVSISFAAIFLKQASPTHPLIVSAARLGIATSLLALPTLRAWKGGRLTPAVLRTALACGVLYGLHFGTWVTSLSMTSVASSVTLVTATPLLLGAASLVTGRDRPSARHWVSMALALVGLTLIGWADLSLSSDALIGDALALAGAAAMAVYLQLVRRLGEDLDVLAFGGVATAVGATTLLIAALLMGVPIEVASPESLLWIALAALIPQLIGHNLLTWALRYATPTEVGISTIGEPVGATLLAWLWLGESVSAVVAAGCVITLVAVFVALRGQRNERASPELSGV